jgi:hypothetical protein
MNRYGASQSPTQTELIERFVENALEQVFVATPGIVQSYDPAKRVADVKPGLKHTTVTADGEEIIESLPVIPNVPVVMPRAGKFFIHLPLAKGDTVLLVFCDRSIEKFMYSAGKEVDPVDLRLHDLSDAVAIPGFYPVTKPLTDVLTDGAAIGKEKGTQVRFKDSTVEVTSKGLPASTGGFVALATKLALAFNSHTHTCPSGGGTSGPPVPTMTAAGVGSKNLKAD